MRWLKQLLCKHSWEHDLKNGTKMCSKCRKFEEVYMGWI